MINKYFVVFQTEAGFIGIAGSSQGICRTTLPVDSLQDALQIVNPENVFNEGNTAIFTGLIADIKKYFRGEPVDFSVLMDFSEVSEFQRAVYQAAVTIPYGETRSYSWIAGKIGNPQAARAVGQALGRNPLPILVPCHRVLQASGSLGGFAGGITQKDFLLKLESSKD